MRRGSIALRLLAAFLVSLLPIGVLAYLSWEESRKPEAAHIEGAEGEAAAETSGEQAFGLPTATVELTVAGAGLALSVLMALYIARTLVSPIRELERDEQRRERRARRRGAPDVERRDRPPRAFVQPNGRGLRREAFVRDLFGQYVTPELAEAAIEHRGQLDGQLVTCSVLFADIRDFTGLAETVPTSGLIEMLNRYFDRMSAVVVDEGGLVNKFVRPRLVRNERGCCVPLGRAPGRVTLN